MTAIVTKDFRLNAAKKFIGDVSNTYPEYTASPDTENRYYLFTGRGESWADDTNPDDPYDNTYSVHTDVWQRMHALKEITDTDVTFAAPRYQWISGTTYTEYDDRDDELEGKKYYVITDNNNVYICLKSGGTSTKNPDVTGVQTSGVIDYTADDGYIWKYLYTVSTDDSNKFLTSAFIPVRYIASQPAVGADTALSNQWDVEDNAVDGAIYHVKVTNGGSGYTSAPTVAIEGDGSSATATATVSNGVVTGVTITNAGAGYNFARVTFTGGGGSAAAARPVIGPKGGFGADPRNDLRAHYITTNISLTYADGGGDFIVGNDFRQIGILRNPYDYGTTNVSTADTMSASYSITLDDTTGSYASDEEIEGTSSGARAIVDHYDSANGVIRYHQTDETGYEAFTTSDNIREYGTSDTGVGVDTLGNPEVQPFSGEVVFLENRTPVNRASDQIETIKLVLEF